MASTFAISMEDNEFKL